MVAPVYGGGIYVLIEVSHFQTHAGTGVVSEAQEKSVAIKAAKRTPIGSVQINKNFVGPHQ